MELPGQFTGRVFVEVEGDKRRLTIDEFEQSYPEEHADYVEFWELEGNKWLKKK